MASLCYRRHRFPPEVIRHAIWLYLRFTLSYRNVEELLAERGLDISYETVQFKPLLAQFAETGSDDHGALRSALAQLTDQRRHGLRQGAMTARSGARGRPAIFG
jgi:hypothetical protein